MDQIELTNRSRQRLLGIVGVCGVVALEIGDALTPAGTDQHVTSVDIGIAELNAAAAHPGLLYVAFLLVILGFFGMAFGFLAIASLVRQRGSRWATTAAAVGAFACFSAGVVNVWSGLDTYAALKANMTRAAAAAFLVSAQHTSAVSALFSVGYFLGLTLAGVLIGVALWRGRAVPRWVAVILPVTLVVAASSPSGIPGTALTLPFSAVMIGLSWMSVRRG